MVFILNLLILLERYRPEKIRIWTIESTECNCKYRLFLCSSTEVIGDDNHDKGLQMNLFRVRKIQQCPPDRQGCAHKNAPSIATGIVYPGLPDVYGNTVLQSDFFNAPRNTTLKPSEILALHLSTLPKINATIVPLVS